MAKLPVASKKPTPWTREEVVRLGLRVQTVDNAETDLIGRDPAKEFFSSHIRTQPIKDHGAFKVFVASGHVRAGKTRIGEELWKYLEIEKETNAIYVQVQLGNGHGYQQDFDGLLKDNPIARFGGRLVQAYFNTEDLRPFPATEALDIIIGLEQNKGKDTIVAHFDEHGQYVHAAADDESVGSRKSTGLLTQYFDLLSSYERSGRGKIIYPIASGTTYNDVAVNHDSHYQTEPLPLASLNLEESLALARDRLVKKRADAQLVDQIMGDTLFKVAVADAGGLPGAVIWAADRALQNMTLTQGTFIAQLVAEARSYAKFPEKGRWEQCILCSFARPPLKGHSVLVRRQHGDNGDEESKDWTVTNASESGSITVTTRGGFKEIRVAPCFLAASDSTHNLPLNTSILLANLSWADGWTWQRFEQAHAHYYAAFLNALDKTQRFWSENVNQNMFVRDVFPHVQSQNCLLLDWIVKPTKDFNYGSVIAEARQSIPRSNAAHGTEHRVDILDFNNVHLAAPGNPITDAHFNLNVERVANDPQQGMTVFMQYKHSVDLEADTTVKVSAMNGAVETLRGRLAKHGWPREREWLFLWVTNRSVVVDVPANENLLWVGREELFEHSPLIGMRGLVAVEQSRGVDDV